LRQLRTAHQRGGSGDREGDDHADDSADDKKLDQRKGAASGKRFDHRAKRLVCGRFQTRNVGLGNYIVTRNPRHAR
jgi:hypothetical protein